METNQNNTTSNDTKENLTPEHETTESRGAKRATTTKINLFKLIRNIVIVVILLLIALFVLDKAPNYKNHDITDRTNLIINNNNITAYLKKDLIFENNYIYLSKQDVSNFFDPYIYYDQDENRIVTTYDTKVTNMFLNNTSITINDVEKTISAPVIKKDDVVYLPISELLETYNMELNYYNDTDIVTIDTLSKEQKKATAKKNLSVKSIKDTFSRTVAKIKANDEVIIIENDEPKGWTKIRTANGVIGYVKTNKLSSEKIIRTAVAEPQVFEGKINLIWDDFYSSIPDRTGTKINGINVISPTMFSLERLGKGEIVDKAEDGGIEYVNWAKSNEYKVWGLVANDSQIETTSEILNSYENRNRTINNILNLAEKYALDGINIDFENMYQNDKDMFTQFIVELYPRLKEKNLTLSVDVTAPDGSETWSMCFDRHDIANNCDYIVFMAYDQYGESSNKAGTTAGLDWIKVGLNKFLKTEEIEPNKIILGLPFYTRLWTENSDTNVTSATVYMRNVTKALPSSAYENKVWDENLGQYYVEYQEGGKTKKMWIEDDRSITEKLKLITDNNLAGAAFWAKGRETPEILEIIKTELGI